MARRSAFKKATQYIQKRLFGLGNDEENFGLAQVYGSDTKSRSLLDTYKGAVYACINLIAESVGGYDPYLYKEVNGKKVDVGDHELLKLLRRPGGVDDKAIPISQFDLMYATASFIELQGECYWYMAKGEISGKPREIVVLRADKVGRYINKVTGDIEAFYVVSTGGQKIRIEIDEMLPFIGFDPKNPYRGKGTTEAAIEYIETDEFSTRFTKNFFKNNAGISGVLSVGGSLAKAAFKKFVRAWREKYQGVDNAGKVMIVRGSDAAKFEKVGLGLDELDMTALRKMSLEDIAMMYRVPLELLGKLGDGAGLGRANIETLEYIFSKYNVDKKMMRYDQILQFALERYWPEEKDLKIAHANIIPEDKEFKLNERAKAVDVWRTRNEVRNEDGLDSVEGGDVLRAPINSLPINEDLSSLSSSESKQFKSAGIKIRIKRKSTAADEKKKTLAKK